MPRLQHAACTSLPQPQCHTQRSIFLITSQVIKLTVSRIVKHNTPSHMAETTTMGHITTSFLPYHLRHTLDTLPAMLPAQKGQYQQPAARHTAAFADPLLLRVLPKLQFTASTTVLLQLLRAPSMLLLLRRRQPSYYPTSSRLTALLGRSISQRCRLARLVQHDGLPADFLSLELRVKLLISICKHRQSQDQTMTCMSLT